MRPTCLILFGAPGSGKGTQAKLLRERCVKGPHISTGDILREHVLTGDNLGHEVAAIMASGQLVPDELVSRLVEERISRKDCAEGFILDGYPRTVQQARFLAAVLSQRGVDRLVIHLKVDYNKIIARLSGRRLCPQCGALYSVAPNAPTISEVCDYDGARLLIRDDDREGRAGTTGNVRTTDITAAAVFSRRARVPLSRGRWDRWRSPGDCERDMRPSATDARE